MLKLPEHQEYYVLTNRSISADLIKLAFEGMALEILLLKCAAQTCPYYNNDFIYRIISYCKVGTEGYFAFALI
jgi:hypothetical protein